MRKLKAFKNVVELETVYSIPKPPFKLSILSGSTAKYIEPTLLSVARVCSVSLMSI